MGDTQLLLQQYDYKQETRSTLIQTLVRDIFIEK